MAIQITIEKQGRRYYVMGDTRPVRAELRDLGCKWDEEARAWWTGKTDVAEAARTLADASTGFEPVEVAGNT